MIFLFGVMLTSTILDKIAGIAPLMQCYTPNMEVQVRQHVDQCQVCKKSKPPTKKYGILPEITTHCDPWEIIQFNLFDPWTFHDDDKVPHRLQELSIIDVVTRWVELYSYTSKQAKDIALLVDKNRFLLLSASQIRIF
jgi:hypothetical protein